MVFRNSTIDHDLNYLLRRVQGDMVEFQEANKNNFTQTADRAAEHDLLPFEEDEANLDFPSAAQFSPYGEIAPSRHDISRIVGEGSGSIGNPRYWIIRGTFVPAKEARIFKQVEKVVRLLKVKDSERRELRGHLMKKLGKIQDETGLALKRAIVGLVYSETRELGVPVDELQRCLARSGINLGTKKLKLIVRQSDACEQLSSCSSLANHILVNGRRSRDIPVIEEIARGYYEVCLVPMLDEVLDGGGELRISIDCDCSICSLDGAEISSNGKSATLLASTRKSSFVPFRMANRILPEQPNLLGDEKERQVKKEKRILAIYNPSSSNHPITRALALRSCCLSHLQSEFLRCYQQITENGTAGTSPRSLARKAVFVADAQVFASLSKEKKLAAWELLMPSLSHLSPEDRRYVLVKGVCLPSEFS